MTSRGSRRLLLSGNELKEPGRREAPLLFGHFWSLGSGSILALAGVSVLLGRQLEWWAD